MITHETRREAYYDVKPETPTRRWYIVQVLKAAPDGLTADEIQAQLIRDGIARDWNPNYCRPRLVELKQAGIIEAVGKRVSARSGKKMAVWRLRDA